VILYLAVRRAASGRTGVPLGGIPTSDRWLIAAAAIANSILNLSVFVAFERISIALTVLVFYVYPALVAIASVVWFGDRLDRIRWVALALSLVGIIMLMAGAGDLGRLDALGVGLAFLGALGQTFYILAARHGFPHVPGAQAAAMTMGGATVLYLAVAAVTGGLAPLVQPLTSGAALGWVMLAGVIGAGIPTVSYIVGIRRLGAPRAAILSTLGPVVGVALAAVLFGEQPSILQVGGGMVIIIAGVTLQFRPQVDLAEHEAVAERDG
jgi:drug/metabolite transporter (DMT)-like permease